MLKRTYGRLLLTLLVITGFAGKTSDESLTKQERKFAITHFKDTRAQLFASVKGLSEQQLNFKSAPDRWSVQECVYHITLVENGLWSMLEKSMSEPATPEKRVEVKFSDEQILSMIKDRSGKFKAPEPVQPQSGKWKSVTEALDTFKDARTAHIKYARTTTEDLRNHLLEMSFGKLDAFQFMLFIAGHSSRHTQQIEEIKSDPAFPKK